MKKTMTSHAMFFCIGLVAALLSSPLLAVPIDSGQSEVKATFKQFNVPITGQFRKISGDVQFNPAQPAQTKGTLTVETASYDLGDAQYNKEVAGKDWFDSKTHPKAVFVIASVSGSGANLYATGDLTIRGIKKSLKFPVKIQNAGGKYIFTGKVPIKRLDYKIGAEGEWGDATLVAHEVVIDFKMVIPAQ